jgi:hypothetical protein
VSCATHAISRPFRIGYIESVGKQLLEESGKYRVNKNDEEIFAGSRADARDCAASHHQQTKTGRAQRGPFVLRKTNA